MAKIILNSPITTDRYGLHFDKGEAHTDNIYLINRLIRKGVKVEIQEEQPEKPKEKTIDEMTVAELKEYTKEKKIEIPADVKNKADIVEFIKNYKKDDEKQEETNENDEDKLSELGENEADKNLKTTNPSTNGQENQ